MQMISVSLALPSSATWCYLSAVSAEFIVYIGFTRTFLFNQLSAAADDKVDQRQTTTQTSLSNIRLRDMLACEQTPSGTPRGKTHTNKDTEVQTSSPHEVQKSRWQETERQVGQSAGSAERGKGTRGER